MKGGLKINAKDQVIDQFGDVIPGLYAAGEVAGGLMGIPSHYYTGTMTLQCFTQGRIAGDNAADEVSS
jgi:urocanate reductase